MLCQVPLRRAAVEHLSREKIDSAKAFHSGGDFYGKRQATGDHTAQLAYVRKYHQLADEAKTHLGILRQLWGQMSQERHARVEQQRLLDKLEGNRIAAYNATDRDNKLQEVRLQTCRDPAAGKQKSRRERCPAALPVHNQGK